jgi:hypothetical protein
MNKKVNTLLFVLGATVFNILTTIVVFFTLFLLYVRFAAASLPESTAGAAVSVFFILALAGSFFIYHKTLKVITKKIDMDKYFDPIFRLSRRRGG